MALRCISALTVKSGVPVVHDGILPGTGVDCDVIICDIGLEKHQTVVDRISPSTAVPVPLRLAGGNDDLAPLKYELSRSPDRRVALVVNRKRDVAIGRGACRAHRYRGDESRFIIWSSFGGTE